MNLVVVAGIERHRNFVGTLALHCKLVVGSSVVVVARSLVEEHNLVGVRSFVGARNFAVAQNLVVPTSQTTIRRKKGKNHK